MSVDQKVCVCVCVPYPTRPGVSPTHDHEHSLLSSTLTPSQPSVYSLSLILFYVCMFALFPQLNETNMSVLQFISSFFPCGVGGMRCFCI